MNIPDRSIEQTIEAVVSQFRRFTVEQTFTYYALSNEYFTCRGKLLGIQLLLLSPRFYHLVAVQVALLEELYYQAETRLADVGRSLAQSAEVVE